MPNYRITVQPTPGAVVTVKGYATGQFEGYYGSDIAFYEMRNDTRRFAGFKASMKRQPIQSFWTYTTDMGLAVHARDKDKYKSWRDLTGKALFTGMPPWDTRAQIERAFEGAGYQIEDFDIGLVGEVMTPVVHTAAPETPVIDLARLMAEKRVHRMIVTEGEQVVGLVSAMDLLQVIAGAPAKAKAPAAERPAASARRSPVAPNGRRKIATR